MPVNADGQAIVGGWVFAEDLGIGDVGVDGATQLETTLNPDDNLYTVRFYGRNGELIEERRMPVEWSETETVTVHDEDVPERDARLSTDETWTTEFTGFDGSGIPHMTYDGNGLNFYGEDGELLWRADGVGMYTQGTSSAEYPARNFDLDGQPAAYDVDTRFTDDEYQRYLDLTRDSAERYLDITYGTRTEQTDEFLRTRSRYLDEIFLKGEWKIPEEEEQLDIEDERGGALDEFLDGFKPQKTKSERSDGQE